MEDKEKQIETPQNKQVEETPKKKAAENYGPKINLNTNLKAFKVK